MPVVKFVKENKQIEVAAGTTIRNAAKQAGINTNQGINGICESVNKYVNCKGFGMCGTNRAKAPMSSPRSDFWMTPISTGLI